MGNNKRYKNPITNTKLTNGQTTIKYQHRIDQTTPVNNKISIRGNSTEYEMSDRQNISQT